ncbi:MAG TPA: hypothetical protein VF199_06550 [Bacillales bacterium]
MSEENNRSSKNVFKTASGEANKLIHQTVDSAGDVVKTFSGSDGLIIKTYDTSSKFARGAASQLTRKGKKDECPKRIRHFATANPPFISETACYFL